MKKLLIIIFMIGVWGAGAQEPIEVKVDTRPSSQGVVTAFEVVVPQATSQEAIDLWKKTIIPGRLLKKSPKMEKVKDEWIVRDILITEITSLPLNVITQVSSFPGKIYVRAFFQSEGGFLGSTGSSEDATAAASRFVRDYGVALYKQAVEKELKTEESVQRKLENELNSMQRKNKNFNRKVTDAKKEQGALREEIRQQEKILNEGKLVYMEGDDSKNSPRADLEKQMKSSEKSLKKAQKNQSKLNRKISKNEREQRKKEDAISQQKSKVEEIRTKLTNIR